jgi:predicted permease
MFIYLFLFLIGFNAVIFSFGVHLISFCDDRKFELKSFFSPPVIAMSFSLLLIYLQAHKFIPESLRVPLRSIGDCTLPLAMLVVGGMLARIDIGKVQKGPLALAILLKLVVLPLVGLLVCLKLGLPELFSLLIIIELAVPSATTLSILVRHFKKEDLLISQGIFFSHLFSIVTIPLFLTFYFWLKVVK